ncbi:cyclic pyranopterin monophosphate synthase accessory protein [Alicyclobacillus contaminans]|uniref:cyclic pyranopterin monophosphate synthase MoaC n=1 Tax=Alicyclobacillus contaminans TaxID=392016 RepID=UPI0003F83872|nr:cyclic pyranopterin monophosphate synthase MoaC [Alicyclobacillus contaminans]GMA52438.1 cyclic pyranopterin monophosphate synthase accessory protein [Alicyclobacillus contaminans]
MTSDNVNRFTHFDPDGRPHMVDVSDKPFSARTAVAEVLVRMHRETRRAVEARAVAKGDVLGVAELAGIMAAKRTAELIPLCHPIPLSKVSLESEWLDIEDPDGACLRICATVKTTHQTGVEMEALTAVSVAALTVYDMCKAFDKAMAIQSTRLLHKSGGRSGTYDASAT